MTETTGPAELDRASAVPLWSQLHDDLIRRMEAAEFTAHFPGELEIRDQYAVSRHTAREALRRLRERGLVASGRGRPSRVAAPGEIEQPLGALYSLFASVETAGLRQRSVVRELRTVRDAAAAERLGLGRSSRLVYLERLRLAGEDPFALDRAWLPAALAAPLLDADFTRTALYTELARRCGVRPSGGSERLRAVVPTPAQRELLDLGPDGAAFAIERVGVSGARPVEWRHTLVRGDRFSVTADFSTYGGYELGVSGPDPAGGA